MQKVTMRFYGGTAESEIVIRDQSEDEFLKYSRPIKTIGKQG